MKTTVLALLLPLATLLALPASAAETAASCPVNADGIPDCPKAPVEVGLRTGVALPLGSASSGAAMSSALDAQVPVQIDFGVRPDPHLFLGAYGSFGFVAPASGVCQGASCSGSDVRFGLEAQYHFRPALRFDPWIGVGAGYEWLHLASWKTNASRDGADTSTDTSVTLRGWELVNVQTGLDYALCTGVHVGPFLGFSLGQYQNERESFTVQGAEYASTSDLSQTALHGWLTLGVRGSFNL